MRLDSTFGVQTMQTASKPSADKPDLEALKQALADAKAIHREAARAVLDAKRVANAARFRATEAFAAYMAARPPSKRPRPKRAATPDRDWPFAEGPAEEVA
jgi:hypothetical protein